VPEQPPEQNAMHTKKQRGRNKTDDLRPEYDLTTLTGAVQGKYYRRATAGTTLVLLAADVAEAFPTGAAVNEALRSVLGGRRNGQPNKALQPTSRAPQRARTATPTRAARG
jgi:hypothetical protein